MIIKTSQEYQPNLPLIQAPSWLSKELLRITNNWRQPMPYLGENPEQVIQDVIAWIKTNSINLINLTLEDAIKQSEPWRREYNEKKIAVNYTTDKVVYKYKDGWKMVLIDNDEDADVEAKIMIWDDYPINVEKEKKGGLFHLTRVVYSLRNASNVPHASINVTVVDKSKQIEINKVVGREEEKSEKEYPVEREPQSQYKVKIKEWIDSMKSQGWKFTNAEEEEEQNRNRSKTEFIDKDVVTMDDYGLALRVYGVGGDADTYLKNLQAIEQDAWSGSQFSSGHAENHIDMIVDYAAGIEELDMLESAVQGYKEEASERFLQSEDDITYEHPKPDEENFMVYPDEKPGREEFKDKAYKGKPVFNQEAFSQAEKAYEEERAKYKEYFEPFQFGNYAYKAVEAAKAKLAPKPKAKKTKKAEMSNKLVKIYKIAKTEDIPDSETIGAYIETLTLYCKDNKDMDTVLADLIHNLPSARQVKREFSEKQCQILFETIQFVWRKITGQDIIKESKITYAPESLSGSYWMLPNGVLLHGLNHFGIVKQNTNLFTSLLDINGFTLQEYMHTGPESLIHFIIKNGGVRMFISKEKKFFVQLSDETYNKWAGKKLKKYDFTEKIIRVIDLKSPYRGWKSGIPIKV